MVTLFSHLNQRNELQVKWGNSFFDLNFIEKNMGIFVRFLNHRRASHDIIINARNNRHKYGKITMKIATLY